MHTTKFTADFHTLYKPNAANNKEIVISLPFMKRMQPPRNDYSTSSCLCSANGMKLDALGRFLPVDGTSGRRGVDLGELVVSHNGAVESLLEDGLGLVELELGLEVLQVVGVAAAVGATAGIDKVELVVDDFLARSAPVR